MPEYKNISGKRYATEQEIWAPMTQIKVTIQEKITVYKAVLKSIWTQGF